MRRALQASLFSAALAVIAALFLPIDRSWMAMPMAAFAIGSLAVAGVRYALAKSSLGHDPALAARTRRLQALGRQRSRIVVCFGGELPNSPHYFDPSSDDDVLPAFRRFVQGRVHAASGDSDPLTQALLGAARLLIGDVGGANSILTHLPSKPPVRDHFAGAALVAPVETLLATLPLGSLDLEPASRWVAGSEASAKVRRWLDEHAAQLVWNERAAMYELDERSAQPLQDRG